MKKLDDVKNSIYVNGFMLGDDGGRFDITTPDKAKIFVIASFGGGWDHVSASLKNRLPTWDEMCFIKDLFFEDNECVVQYHPPKSQYVNNYKYCLHIWKPQKMLMPMPPSIMVGIKGLELE